jgi:PLP dependent protein
VAGLTERLDAARVRANLVRIREEMARDDVEILAAVKYVALEELGALAEAGVTLVGENRAQELERKASAFPGFTWDFIGHVQSRKVKQILPHVRLIHSVASDSVLRQLARHATPETEVLVEVNVAREPGKSGIDPGELDAFLERCPCRVGGLMTMPPETSDPEASRRWFAELARLAGDRGLPRLSMGTSQDYVVAAQEGATIVRIGTKLYG